MLERIGTTRFGNPVEVFWYFDKSEISILWVSRFDNKAEEYDGVAVLEARSIVCFRSSQSTLRVRVEPLEAVTRAKRRRLGAKAFRREAITLGHTTSVDRTNYGRTLLYPPGFALG